MDDRENLVTKSQTLLTLKNGDYIAKDEFLREYKLTTSDILRAGFDGYASLVLAAGGKVSTSKQIYSDEGLLDDIVAVGNQLGQLPTQDQYEAFGKFSPSNLKKRFGSWSKATEEAKSRADGPLQQTGISRAEPRRHTKAPQQRTPPTSDLSEAALSHFSEESQRDVDSMASHYAKLYSLERQMRSTIALVLRREVGDSWWDNCVPQDIRDNATKNVKAEERLGRND